LQRRPREVLRVLWALSCNFHPFPPLQPSDSIKETHCRMEGPHRSNGALIKRKIQKFKTLVSADTWSRALSNAAHPPPPLYRPRGVKISFKNTETSCFQWRQLQTRPSVCIIKSDSCWVPVVVMAGSRKWHKSQHVLHQHLVTRTYVADNAPLNWTVNTGKVIGSWDRRWRNFCWKGRLTNLPIMAGVFYADRRTCWVVLGTANLISREWRC
jgi:hypothetical protein